MSDTSSLKDIDITSELSRRPPRPPDYEAENRALVALADVMASDPHTILQKLADAALELCQADSSGISILESDCEKSIFRWHATAGKFGPVSRRHHATRFQPVRRGPRPQRHPAHGRPGPLLSLHRRAIPTRRRIAPPAVLSRRHRRRHHLGGRPHRRTEIRCRGQAALTQSRKIRVHRHQGPPRDRRRKACRSRDHAAPRGRTGRQWPGRANPGKRHRRLLRIGPRLAVYLPQPASRTTLAAEPRRTPRPGDLGRLSPGHRHQVRAGIPGGHRRTAARDIPGVLPRPAQCTGSRSTPIRRRTASRSTSKISPTESEPKRNSRPVRNGYAWHSNRPNSDRGTWTPPPETHDG